MGSFLKKMRRLSLNSLRTLPVALVGFGFGHTHGPLNETPQSRLVTAVVAQYTERAKKLDSGAEFKYRKRP